ncbi:MAG: tape measure protein [Gemmatimonadaceae bacterium]|nr:tape measure protein [Gemmatimonadaceae bacterium]
MAKLTEILATLKLDAKQFDAALRSSDDSLKKFTQNAQTNGGGVGKVFGALLDTISALPAPIRLAVAAFATLNIGRAIMEAAKLAETYTLLEARIANLSDTQTDAAMAQAGVEAIAQRTNQSLEGTAEIYSGVATAAKEMGKSVGESLRFTEAAQRAIALSNRGIAGQQAATLQLSQALASGQLQGDEFRSLRENAPRLIKAIADGLGVTTGELRALSKEGKLTADVIFEALISQTGKLASEMGNLRRTQAQANQGVKDELMKLAADSEIVQAFQKLGVRIADALREAIAAFNDPNQPRVMVATTDVERQVVSNLLSNPETNRTVGMVGALDGSTNIVTSRKTFNAELARVEDLRQQAADNALFQRRQPRSAEDLAPPDTMRLPDSPLAPKFDGGTAADRAARGDISEILRKQEDERKDAERKAKQLRDEQLRIAKEARDLSKELEAELLKSSGNVGKAIQVELNAWVENVQATIAKLDPNGDSPATAQRRAQLDAVRELRQQAIDAQNAIEATLPTITAAERVLSDTSKVPESATASASVRENILKTTQATAASRSRELDTQKQQLAIDIQRLEAEKVRLTTQDVSKQNVAAIKALEEQIATLRGTSATIDDSRGTDRKAGSLSDDTKRAAGNAEQLSQSILTAVDGAIALANAFDGVSDSTRKVLSNLSLIARGAVDAIGTIKKLRESNTPLSSGTGLLALGSAALPIIGGLASLASGVLSESPEDKQRREELRANTDAIRALTQRAGDLASANVAGRTLGAARTVADRVISAFGSQRVLTGTVDIGSAARAGGTTAQDLQAVASALGVTLNGTVQSFRDLKAAIDTADLKSFTDTFAGSMQRFDDTLKIDGVTDPVEIFRRRVAVLTDQDTGFPALAQAINGLDLSTVEGRDSASTKARDIFDLLASGKLTSAQLGGLSVSEARNVLVAFITGARDLNKDGVTGSGGFNESRTITEVTGSRLAGLLGTGNTYLAEIAKNTAPLRVSPLALLTPPSIAGLTSVGATTVTFERGSFPITLTITVPMGANGTAAGAAQFGEALGTEIADTLIRQLLPRLDAALGQRAAERRLLNGDPRLVN